jgi:hypothetical protein
LFFSALLSGLSGKKKIFIFIAWKVSRRFGKVKYAILKFSSILGDGAHFRSLGKGKDYRRGRRGSQRRDETRGVRLFFSAVLSGLCGKKIKMDKEINDG